MSDIERIRELLEKREKDEGARGTAFYEIHLDDTLVEQLVELRGERQGILLAAPQPDGRLSDPPPPDTADVDARIAAKEEEIKASTVRVDFAAVFNEYEEIIAKYPNVDDNDRERWQFLDELAVASVTKITIGGGKPVDDPAKFLPELMRKMTFGEKSPLRDVVYTLNRRKISVPF